MVDGVPSLRQTIIEQRTAAYASELAVAVLIACRNDPQCATDSDSDSDSDCAQCVFRVSHCGYAALKVRRCCWQQHRLL